MSFNPVPDSIGSSETFGSPSLTKILYPSSVSTVETFGSPSLTKILYPSSVSTVETFGSPSLTKILYPSSISTVQAFGSPNLIKVIVPADWNHTSLLIDSVEPIVGYIPDTNYTTLNVRTFGNMYAEGVSEGSADANDDEYDGLVTSTTTVVAGVSYTHATLKQAEKHLMNIRAVPVIEVTTPDPVIFRGQPVIPRVLCENVGTTEGTGSHDPDPSDDDDAHVWKVGDLIEPGESEYWLEDWEETGGGLSWISQYPYRPRVHKRYEFFDNDTEHIYTKSLSFNYQFVEHMWLDLGSATSELTVMMGVMIQRHAKNSFTHHLLDAGTATPVRSSVADGLSYTVDDGLDYRAAMVFGRSSSWVNADKDDYRKGKHIKANVKAPRMPRVAYAVFNGDNSIHGSYAPGKRNKVMERGALAPKSIRKLVLGREQNHISRQHASDMSVFEVRIYTRALSSDELDAKSKRIMGRYKFNKYWD